MEPGQTVVVIGGSAGIGLETARRARTAGADVILTGRNSERLQHAAGELGALSTATFDANDSTALEDFFAHLDGPIDHVMVNLIAAGFVDTPLSASLLGDRLEERRDQLRATLPIGRVVGPAEVVALAVHIMSNTALTGATYDIDGGQQLVSH
jgi:NAD(P)-dependent dehydrogenase (short-subunit alcohol dehydrogenase family)